MSMVDSVSSMTVRSLMYRRISQSPTYEFSTMSSSARLRMTALAPTQKVAS